MALPPWTTIHTHLTLYHGCLASRAASIDRGVRTGAGRADTDFGRGFYTTTRLDQATAWARQVYWDVYPAGNPADPPAVVKFVVPLAGLAGLNALPFVRGDATNITFWSFVTHCRGGNSHAHPVRIPPDDWYDMVVGPVASWPPKAGVHYCHGSSNAVDWEPFDQFSFHRTDGTDVLNDCDRKNPNEFEVIPIAP